MLSGLSAPFVPTREGSLEPGATLRTVKTALWVLTLLLLAVGGFWLDLTDWQVPAGAWGRAALGALLGLAAWQLIEAVDRRRKRQR
jgi:hypothetical protein